MHWTTQKTQYTKALGRRMREVRRRRFKSMADVEKASNGRWPTVTLGSYERGDRQINVVTLAELAEFYGTNVADLLPWADVKE